MVKSCCVYNCTNRYNSTSKFSGISFFRFPKDKRQRRAWIKAINRENWAPNDNTWVCSVHFIDGWHGYDPSDQNYAPTLFSYKAAVRDVAQVARDSRKLERQQAKEAHEKHRDENVQEECHKRLSLYMHSNYCDIPSDHEPDHGNETTNVMKTKDAGTLCDPDPLSKENEKLQEELRETKRDLQRERWGVHRIADNDSLTKFYTSLPTFAMFLWLFSYLKDKCERMTYWTGESHTLPGTDRTRARRSHLQPIDQLLAVLMRNRLGLFVQDIAERFCIAPSTFSKYYTTWLCLLHKELKFLNPFPAKDVVQRTMPSQLKKFPNTRIIIDCTEIFIQKSSSLTNQSLTFSNYKNHNTAKFLVGITPSGIISFVSEGWGGKVSDRQITEESGLLDLLEPGDSVMADKGFTITDLLKQRGCYLNILPFLRNDHQFTVEDVYNTQEIAQLRIHVERSIGLVKNFHIFDGVLPLSMIPLVSKLFQVCCWLSNLDVPLVEDK